MTWLRFLGWGATILAVGLLFFVIESLINRKNRWWIFLIEAVINAVLATAGAYLVVVAELPFVRYIFFPVGVFPLSLLALAAYDLIMMVIHIFPKVHLRLPIKGGIAFLLVLGWGTYGTVNSQVIVKNEITYKSEKLSKDHTFIFISDLHYGITQTEAVVDGALQAIKAENPEALFLGGDIVDEYTTKEQMKSLFQRIGSLGIPTYYIYGNHDRQTTPDNLREPYFSKQELADAIEDSGITILCDTYDLIGDDIVLMGREDYSESTRKKVEELPAFPKDRYLINLDHSPYITEETAALAPDLQLSGHTHAGQFFPLRSIYIPVVTYVCGDHEIKSGHLYVSAGISGWYVPGRTEAHCTYEVIHLNKA